MNIINFNLIDSKNSYEEFDKFFHENPHIYYQLTATCYFFDSDISFNSKFNLTCAIKNGNLAGVMLIKRYSYCNSLNYIFVYPEYRNQGVAKRIIKNCNITINTTALYSMDGYKYIRPMLINMNIEDADLGLGFDNPIHIKQLYEENGKFYVSYIKNEIEKTKDITTDLNNLYNDGAYLSFNKEGDKYLFEIDFSGKVINIPYVYFLYANRNLFF